MDRLLETQLAALGVSVDQPVRERLLWLGEELLRWNRRVNLTAITRMEDVVEKHLVDSLALMPLFSGQERTLDVGSGGGFPGLPLKIVFDALRLVSVDAVAKKINFQRHVVRQLALTGCVPLHARVEDVPQWEAFDGGFDLIVSRAFASLGDFVSLTLPCLSEGGRLVAMKGPEGERELSQSAGLLAELGVTCVGIERSSLPGSGAERVLITLQKAS
jgi:16S rRNA (guanine527-N7)-methyltransferase